MKDAVESMGGQKMGVGQKLGDEKPRYDLIPAEALEEMAKVLSKGAEKYAPRNWEYGVPYSKYYRAAIGHLNKWKMGQDSDPETGLSHLAHAGCCVLFLLTFVQRDMGEFDDRELVKLPPPELHHKTCEKITKQARLCTCGGKG